MQKDVIYIDVDDDITAVIGKVKDTKKKIVALVPPKRIGMLQSAVNLRLLNRAAKQQDKKIVLISNNQQLTALAGMTGIPVAKTLQSKPEIAQIAALDIDNGEEVIDGSDLAIGEHVRQSESAHELEDTAIASAVGVAAVSGTKPSKQQLASPDSGKKPKVKNNKVPNFNKFRKRLVLIILAVSLLIGFFVWAVFFAPHANVIVKMRTTDAAVSQQVTLSSGAETSVKNSIISAETKQIKKEVSTTFSASGEKNIGERASGSVRMYTSAVTILRSGLTVPVGTIVASSNGQQYTTTDVAVFERADSDGLDGIVVGVQAKEPGEKYNGASGSAGVDIEGITSAEFETITSGGTDKKVKVATADDIRKAREEAIGDVDKTAAKSELIEQFGDEYIIIDDSVIVSTDGVKSGVNADDEVPDGTAKVSGEVRYTIYAVEKNELDMYLKSVLEQQLDDSEEQRVYSSGVDEVTFTNIDKSDSGISASLTTNGSTGPNITDEDVKELARDKRYGEVKSAVEAINGVETVDVEFSTFWVRKVPNDKAKITVEFKVDDAQ